MAALPNDSVSPTPALSPMGRNYVLGVLMVIYAFNFVDRLALGMLLQDIKADLGLSDTQLGLLSGFAFALFYSVVGIPIARWSDRGDRVRIISLAIGLWSVMVALCGMATSFAQLLATRIAVAVGEAGCVPPAHSLIADFFSRAERPRAVAVYMLGGPLSAVIGYFGAGWLNDQVGWRWTFALLGVPGLLLALLAILTLRDPRRDRRSAPRTETTEERSSDPTPPLRAVLRLLWANRTFRHLLVAFTIMLFFGAGISKWQPAFFIRTHGLSTTELGFWFALIWGLGGLAGTYLGGALATRFAAHNEWLQLRAMALLYAAFGLVSAGIYLSHSLAVALVLMAVAAFGAYAATGPLFATMQTLVPARMRASSIAIVYLFANLIGLGLGPVAVGAVSDALQARFGADALRFALAAMSPGYLWASWHLIAASRTVGHDLAAAPAAERHA